ncbi:septum formation initiator family protein [Salipaludibacillus agaradhaerens]|uniref:FtsB family cell division protein n=1 Tax=Salipaludibacillus agaradhaerens TaxID=76935 RepID=UPI0021512177|nr:septum formation initiator family protein [Salipaludibacillus agaradhaerens]MCR6104764.1 septum formation initiator family protein [Salipaludibacillus agaradhaerens]MCR6116812.1 septum formation initiator family protein [Salipaludibacillus agaradhaerens]UJW56005.1 septum formation initiator family protein [Bacillus sp. A116_S68]
MQQDNQKKIRRLTSEYMEKQVQMEEQRLRRQKGLVRRLSVFAVVFLIILGAGGSVLYQQHVSIQKQQETNESLEKELVVMEKEASQLEQEIKWLNDPEYIAELARRDYFLTQDGEILFQLPRQSTEDN